MGAGLMCSRAFVVPLVFVAVFSGPPNAFFARCLAQEQSPENVLSASVSSLHQTPKTADFYWGGYGWRKHWNSWVDGALSQQLKKTAAWGKTEQAFREAWKQRRGEMRRARAIVENQSFREAILFLDDLVASDVFVMAEQSLSDTLERLEVIQRQAHWLLDERKPNAEKAEIVYSWIDQLLPGAECPTLVFGARFSNRERALTKIDEIEGLLRYGVGALPGATEAVKLLERVEDGRGTRLRWRITGERIPWDSLPTNEIVDRESLDRLRELLSGKAITLTLGMDGDYFIFRIGHEDRDWRTDGSESLYTHPDLQLARDHATRPVTSVGYVSDALAQSVHALSLKHFFRKSANRSLFLAAQELEVESGYRDWLIALMDDAAWIDDEIGQWVPSLRGQTQISFLTDHGWETHQHRRTDNRILDGRGHLHGLLQADAPPVLMLDLRLAQHPEYFRSARAIVQRLRQRTEEWLALPPDDRIDEGARSAITEAAKYWPQLERLANAWESKLLPSMEGEHMFVVHSASEGSRVPSWALHSKIDDEATWSAGLLELESELRSLLAARGQDIPWMPELSVQGGWSVVSNSGAQARLVQGMGPIGYGHGVFDPVSPTASAAFLDLGGIARMLKPWIQYVLLQSLPDPNASLPIRGDRLPFEVEFTVEEVLEVWNALESLGELASVTTMDRDGSSRSRAVYTSRTAP